MVGAYFSLSHTVNSLDSFMSAVQSMWNDAEMLMAGVPVPMIKRHVGWAPGSEAVNGYYDHAGRFQMLMPTAAMGSRACPCPP